MTLGQNIENEIAKSGQLQIRIAEKAGIKVASLNRYIHDIRIPKATVLARIANAIGCDVNVLLDCNKEESNRKDPPEPFGVLDETIRELEKIPTLPDAIQHFKRMNKIAEWLDAYRKILILPNCNDCGNIGCGYDPDPGQTVRFNCPLWKEREETT